MKGIIINPNKTLLNKSRQPVKLQVGDVLYEPLSSNTGEITQIIPHPDGKIVKIRWRPEDHLPHDSEHFHKKVVRCIKNGEYEFTPKTPITES
jgi:hypothetical protein